MTLPEYITATRTTDLVNTVKHAALGLISEVGEVYGVLARIERGDPLNRAERMAAELGDVAWYLARLTDLTGNLRPGLVADCSAASIFDTEYSALNSIGNIAHLILIWPHDVLTLAETVKFWARWSRLCQIEGLDPMTVLESNLTKLRDRAARKVIRGDGDHR